MPIVTMIAGPNGSGKSTLIRKLQELGADFAYHLNADEFAKSIGGGNDAARAAQQIVREARDDFLRRRIDYSWETVMSHPSHIDHFIAARRAGYTARLIFVAVDDPLVSVLRVRERVQAGGHAVPEDRIEARYWRCLDQLPRALLASDEARIFDNSDLSEPFRLIARIRGDHIHFHEYYSDMPAWFQRTIQTLVDRAVIEPY
jgi:predicted ABC-type ATPase